MLATVTSNLPSSSVEMALPSATESGSIASRVYVCGLGSTAVNRMS